MSEIEENIKSAKSFSEQRKSVLPNLFRFLTYCCLLFIFPKEWISLYIFFGVFILFALIWLILEYIFPFDYIKYPFLRYFPATSDIIMANAVIYLNGAPNSIFVAVITVITSVSTIFSSDTKQRNFILIISCSLYIILCILLYLGILPHINLLEFHSETPLFKYLLTIVFFLFIILGSFSVLKTIADQNKILLKKVESLAKISEEEKNKSHSLLLNILPEKIVDELKSHGKVIPHHYENVSVLFTDFHNFTSTAEKMKPEELIQELDSCFSHYDKIMEIYNLEKLKTIGDSYMCASGIPVPKSSQIVGKKDAVDIVLAALSILQFMLEQKKQKDQKKQNFWEVRIGIHSGPLVAGIIGEKKFAYDVWGDTVNIASRMESHGANSRINISGETYALVKDFFDCEHRGLIPAKNKGQIEMYFVKSIKPELCADTERQIPNQEFINKYNKL